MTTQAEFQSPLERASFLGAILVFACLGLFCVQFAVQADIRHLLVRIVDDASYYFVIARNIAVGHGVTFDGVHPTDGFHPLWLMMLVPLFQWHGTPETMLRLVILLQTLLLMLAFIVLHRSQSRMFSQATALGTGIIFAFLVCLQSINGMESALFVLLLVVLYAQGLQIARSRLTWPRALMFGVTLGLVLLSRLDMVFIPLAIVACSAPFMLARDTRHRTISAVAIAAAGGSAVVIPYLLFNYTQFGAFVPISGALKSSFPAIALSSVTLHGISNRNYAFVLLAAGWLLFRALRALRAPAATSRPAIDYYTIATTVLAWAVLLHFANTVLFMKWGVLEWHFILYPLFAVLLLAGIIDALLRSRLLRGRPVVYLAAVAVLLALTGWREYGRNRLPLDRIWHVAAYEAALWARAHTPADTVFAMSDAGHFAYFSERRVINLDGLVNTMELQRALLDRRLHDYLRANHVDFLVQHALRDQNDVLHGTYDSLALRYISHKYDVTAEDVIVRNRDEVYRSTPYFDGTDPAVFLIWSFDHNDTDSLSTALPTAGAAGS